MKTFLSALFLASTVLVGCSTLKEEVDETVSDAKDDVEGSVSDKTGDVQDNIEDKVDGVLDSAGITTDDLDPDLNYEVDDIKDLLKKVKKRTEVVEISCDKGEMLVYLYDDTPKHKANFLELVKSGFYDGTTFHRVIETFMIQGGDPNTKDPEKGHLAGQGGPGYTIEAEIKKNHYHKRGVLAAARTGDDQNPERRSSGSQFYVVQGRTFTKSELDRVESVIAVGTSDPKYKLPEKVRATYMQVGGAPWLDMQYTAFGEIITGFDVLDAIAAVKTGAGHKPMADIAMKMKVKKLPARKLKKLYNKSLKVDK